MAERYRASDFDYDYPPTAVAQRPLADRSASRLLVLDRGTGEVSHRRFREFPTLLSPGDVLVLNISRVIPARLRGTREGGQPAELLLVRENSDGSWFALVHPGAKLKPGRTVRFGDTAEARIEATEADGLRRVRFDGPVPVRDLLHTHGTVPLPPYIRREPEPADRERYQTVYATQDGSVAAPTAGLHFTPDLLDEIRRRGVRIVHTVLHVGPGTFRPVEHDDLSRHRMHAEWYAVPEETAAVINQAKQHDNLVWAVGTTVARSLETAAASAPAGSTVAARSGWTDLFIYPPYTFRAVDRLLTNFHLPRSTLLMLVAAFAGYEVTMTAYRRAVAAGYRLFSYGDAMAVI